MRDNPCWKKSSELSLATLQTQSKFRIFFLIIFDCNHDAFFGSMTSLPLTNFFFPPSSKQGTQATPTLLIRCLPLLRLAFISTVAFIFSILQRRFVFTVLSLMTYLPLTNVSSSHPTCCIVLQECPCSFPCQCRCYGVDVSVLMMLLVFVDVQYACKEKAGSMPEHALYNVCVLHSSP